MSTVKMPVLGESVAEGTIVKWYKKEGDKVNRDEMLLEVSTDKVDTEIPSPSSGVVKKILVPEGNTIPVRTDIAEIEEAGQAPLNISEEKIEGKGEAGASVTELRADRTKVLSPLVRRLAKEKGVDLTQIKGTGEGGRVTKADVLSIAEEPAVEKPKKEVQKLKSVPGTRVEPVSFMRKSIADHMIKSAITAAQVTNVVEVDMTNVSNFRSKHKDEFKEKEKFSLSYLPIVAKVTVEALKEFPVVNASLSDDSIVYHDYVNLGIAVALEDGLIVPVIKHAEEKSVVGLARAINDLAARAREKKLVPDDVQEGTFSITNQGVFGSMFSTPIINYPQAAILSLETIVKRVTIIDDAITIRPMVYMPLSWDHRIMDGAIAAQFLSKIKNLLENWDVDQPL